MKKFLPKLFMGLAIFALIVFGIEIFGGYLVNHTYYNGMFANWTNRKLVIWSIVSSTIPVLYILFNKKFSLKAMMLYVFSGLILFSIVHVATKGDILGVGAFVMLLLNTAILVVLGSFFVVGTFSVGSWLSSKFIKFKQYRWEEMMIEFGIGLGAILVLVRWLIQLNIFFGVIIWFIFIAMGVVIYFQKKKLKDASELFKDIFRSLHIVEIKKNNIMWIAIVLLVFSLMYYFYGFNLSFIPYSTAWDANHAYMYLPKVWSLNNGVIWDRGGSVGLWHTFIAIWFALIKPIKSWFWLAPDTIAVAMNFLSGMFVLFFGVGLVNEVIDYFDEKINLGSAKKLAGYTGWFTLLLWLTSGMGAFLVFVDNKTDLGVMAMTILAMLSGFIFLRYILGHKATHSKLDLSSMKYIIISGFLFALATLAKPTAFIDAVLFGLLMFGLRFNWVVTIGAGVFVMGLLGKIGMGSISEFIPHGSNLSYILMAIGAIILLVGIVLVVLNKKSVKREKINYLKYVVLWGFVFLGSIIILKGPGVIYQYMILKDDASISDVGKRMLFGSSNHTLLASSDVKSITVVNKKDKEYLKKNSMALSQCEKIDYTDEELNEDLREPIVKNEDRGRYIGYGWREFKRPNKLFSLGYGILRTFFHKDGECYAYNNNVDLLCQNGDAIDKFDVPKLQSLVAKLDKNSTAYTLLQEALDAYEDKDTKSGVDLSKLMRSEIINIRQYYQSNAVKVVGTSIFIPYRYIIPLNVSYNWSLQNLSSYYTDIGFVWLLIFMLLVIMLIYYIALKKYKYFVLTITTTVGWIIWWLIGGGIVWYGIGLFMWTVLIMSLWIYSLLSDSEYDRTNYNWLYVLLFIFFAWGLTQLTFNYIRISSQGAGGPFVWYKMNTGKVNEVGKDLQSKQVIKYGYNQKNVFDLQFPHYNKFIDYVKDRPDEDGVLIAGTYLQYFLDNQKNIKMDGMLSWFWKQASDNNSCKTYQRLKKAKLKYIVIDPNIGTVVMGEGNESLFNRFFAKRDPITGLIEDHGAISMLVKLWKDGYIRLFSTNNLGAKYAFTLDDSKFRKAFGDISDDQLHFIRAQLGVARFFPNAQQLIGFVANMFSLRMQTGEAIGDIADVFGRKVDDIKVFNVAKQFIEKSISPIQLQDQIENLTQDERLILSQYLSLYDAIQKRPQQYQSMLNSLLQSSLSSSSQLMVFELLD